MADRKGFSRTPLALVVDDQEWTARSLESILSPNGYAVLKAYTGRQALELARKVQPEILVIDMHLPDMRGAEVCRQMRELPTIRESTPIVMLTTSPLGRAERIEALRAGAWDVVRPPFDSEELLLKIGRFVTAKQEADEAREDSLLDPITGFYNVKGLLRRVSEVTAEATRSRRPLACVVLGMNWHGEVKSDDAHDGSVPGYVTTALASTARVSDILGRLGEGNFVIVAPGTDPSGAHKLAVRLLAAADEGLGGEGAPLPKRLRAGYYAVQDTEEATITPVDLLTRATLALRKAQGDDTGRRIHGYDTVERVAS
jgi:PleD family two-component response regulator